MMLMPSERLRHAVIHNNLAIVQRLLRRFPSLLYNTDLDNGWTSLHYAAYHGNFEICVFLCSLGHDAAEISLDTEEHTPLHLSSMANREQTIHFLAQKFPYTIDWVTSADKTVSYTALLLAAEAGHDASVNILLDFGADIDKPDSQGNRAIHYASQSGYKKVMRMLVDRGADYKSPNLSGWTPMDYCFSIQTRTFFSSITIEIERRQEAELRKKLLEKKLSAERPLSFSKMTEAPPHPSVPRPSVDTGRSSPTLVQEPVTAPASIDGTDTQPITPLPQDYDSVISTPAPSPFAQGYCPTPPPIPTSPPPPPG
ncbi:ankyrin repeat-containing domain protein [Limtongia smithiae]|uniref:ankyrin repeat-containing domain protein n=1 Tax=Limtongia smithiae TaxID=1125753 RepID=UPI0034CE94D8